MDMPLVRFERFLDAHIRQCLKDRKVPAGWALSKSLGKHRDFIGNSRVFSPLFKQAKAQWVKQMADIAGEEAYQFGLENPDGGICEFAESHNYPLSQLYKSNSWYPVKDAIIGGLSRAKDEAVKPATPAHPRSKYTTRSAYWAGVEMAKDDAPLNALTMAHYLGAPRHSVNPRKRPDLIEACTRGYRTVKPNAGGTRQKRTSITNEEILSAVKTLAASGERLTWARVSELVGCSVQFWSSRRGANLKSQLRKLYDELKVEVKPVRVKVLDIDEPLNPDSAPCGNCINREVPLEDLQKFEHTPYLCPECAAEYLEALQRDKGVLAA